MKSNLRVAYDELQAEAVKETRDAKHNDVANQELIEEEPIVAWPDLHEAALHGLAGAFVRVVLPYSEADALALLSLFLVAFGNIVGRGPHFTVEDRRHYLNLFCVLVGATGVGRKGTAWGRVERVVVTVDELWAHNCIAGGMSSGEGLIFSVRDAVYEEKQNKTTKQYETVMTDGGVEDKRLLVFEGEFASVLKAQGREGNTLSMVIRNLWDTGDARSMVKTSPMRTTGAHVSIIGHITPEELRSCLADAAESTNGYVNRFLLLCVRRRQFLPRGGSLMERELTPLKIAFRRALEFAQTTGEMSFDEDAWALWDSVYQRLESGRTGLLGKVTQRASPMVRRLA